MSKRPKRSYKRRERELTKEEKEELYASLFVLGGGVVLLYALGRQAECPLGNVYNRSTLDDCAPGYYPTGGLLSATCTCIKVLP